MTTFSDLGLGRPILDTLTTAGYDRPTPIQALAIPPVLAGRDLVGIAATGTGKTAAFALPLLERFAARPTPAPRGACRALVLAPTRELAAQIGDSFRTYGRALGVRVAVVVGGAAFGPQTAVLTRGVHVLVATPGRLLDHVTRRTVRLDAVDTLVLDEADHMLDLGFIPDVRRLIARMPEGRQSLLFSATMPGEIRALAEDFLREPETVSAAPPATPAERVDQRLIHVAPGGKSGLLTELLRDGDGDRVLVFTRTKRGADRVVRGLAAARIEAVAIHGNKTQGQRLRALAGFKAGHAPVLVATDIAARGIDVDAIRLVVNYDLPNVPETYVHRIGRTGRAGAEGTAISFCSPDERPLLRAIEALIGKRIPGRDGGAAEPPRTDADAGHRAAARSKPAAKQPRAKAKRATQAPTLEQMAFMRPTEDRAKTQRRRSRRPARRPGASPAPAAAR